MKTILELEKRIASERAQGPHELTVLGVLNLIEATYDALATSLSRIVKLEKRVEELEKAKR